MFGAGPIAARTLSKNSICVAAISVARVENRQSRPDVLAAFPMLPSDLCGFGRYLACPPFRPLLLGVTTSSGTIEIEIDGAAAQSVARNADVTERIARNGAAGLFCNVGFILRASQ